MKHLFFFFGLCFCRVLQAEPFADLCIPWQDRTPYESTTKRFLKTHPYSEIQSTLRAQSIKISQKRFYDIVIEQEERGHIGYNASAYTFRIFQDIIRMTLEEILELEFKKDFYFFRIPSDPQIFDFSNGTDFIAKHLIINDNKTEQRNQLISTNFTPYSNFDQKYECTAVFFEQAISYLPPNFSLRIAQFFDELGISQDQIPALFELGQMIKHPDGGTLFQFFDFSHQDPMNKNAYEFIDQFAYPAKKRGNGYLKSMIFFLNFF